MDLMTGRHLHVMPYLAIGIAFFFFAIASLAAGMAGGLPFVTDWAFSQAIVSGRLVEVAEAAVLGRDLPRNPVVAFGMWFALHLLVSVVLWLSIEVGRTRAHPNRWRRALAGWCVVEVAYSAVVYGLLISGAWQL